MFKTAAGRLESGDIDEHSQLVQPWDLNMRQMSPGRFRGRLEYVQVHDIVMYREYYTRRVMGTGATPSGYLMVGSPSSLEHDIDWCGAEVRPEQLAFARPSAEVDFAVPEGSRHVVVLVPEDKLLGYLGVGSREKLYGEERRHLRCGSNLGDALVATIHRLIDGFLANPESLADDTLCNAVEWQLLGTLVQALHAGKREAGRMSPSKRRLALLRAVDYAENLHRPISSRELAEVAGVSQRALELAFKEILGIPPARFLRWNRMNQARSVLLAAEPGADRVKHIAGHWGFTEMGRFAVDFKWLFGESPSQTLARKASKPSLRLADILGRVTNEGSCVLNR